MPVKPSLKRGERLRSYRNRHRQCRNGDGTRGKACGMEGRDHRFPDIHQQGGRSTYAIFAPEPSRQNRLLWTCIGPVLIFQLSFNFPYTFLHIPFNLLNFAFDLLGFVTGQFANFFTNLSLDFLSFSLYLVLVHGHHIHVGVNNTCGVPGP